MIRAKWQTTPLFALLVAVLLLSNLAVTSAQDEPPEGDCSPEELRGYEFVTGFFAAFGFHRPRGESPGSTYLFDPSDDAYNPFGLQSNPDEVALLEGGNDIQCVSGFRTPLSEELLDGVEAAARAPQPVEGDADYVAVGYDSTLEGYSRPEVDGNAVYFIIETAGDAWPPDDRVCSHVVHAKVPGDVTYAAVVITGEDDPKNGKNRAFGMHLSADRTATSSYVAVDSDNIIGSASPGPVWGLVRDNLVAIAVPESELRDAEAIVVDVTCHHRAFFTDRTNLDASTTDVVALPVGSDASETFGELVVMETTVTTTTTSTTTTSTTTTSTTTTTAAFASETPDDQEKDSETAAEDTASAAQAADDASGDAGNAIWLALLFVGAAVAAAGLFLVGKRKERDSQGAPGS